MKSSVAGHLVIAAALLGFATVGRAACPDPNSECLDGSCCATGLTCNLLNSDICCRPGFPLSCRNTCCSVGSRCSADGYSCICSDPNFPVRCGLFTCCAAGQQCAPDGESCIGSTPCPDPNFPVDCHTGFCCRAGTTCNTINSRICCPAGFPLSCPNSCCPSDTTCHPSNSQICCRAGFPVACQNTCCPAGHQCAPDGASCIDPNACSNPIGEILAGDLGECFILGADDELVELSEGMPLCDDVTLYCTSEALSPLRVTLNPSGENIATVLLEPRSRIRVRRSLSGIAIWALEGSGRFFFASTDTHFEVELRVNSPAVIVRPNGTIFDVAYDGQAQQSTVRVEEGSVEVTPTYPPADPSDLSTLQPRAAPITLHAGEAVVVGSDTIGSVTLLCLAGQCDDGDACTADTCSPTACGHASASGFDAVCSACRGGLGSRACTDQPVPTTVGKRFALACTLRDQAGGRTPKAAQKLLRRAKKNLKSAAAAAKKAAMKHKHAISSDCADTIVGVLHGPS